MSKRPAAEALDAMEGVMSPLPKKQKSQGLEGLEERPKERRRRGGGDVDDVDDEDDGDNGDEDEDDTADTQVRPPIRQAAPSEGYGDLYLDTIDRQVLDFDFEKLCSISLSNINVYACLVCGRYYQGRGPKSHAYFHALEDDHHVFINMQTQRVYVLPEGYEVRSRSLDDIKFVADPRYTRDDVRRLDRLSDRTAATSLARPTGLASLTLTGRPYTPGYVGMNNIKENDYLNVVVQALAHVPPLRNFFLLDEAADDKAASAKTAKTAKTGAGDTTANRELVRRFGLLVRKIWNPRAFKAHVSPHELLQEIALRSSKRFTLTAQSDPADFLTWFLNHLHLGLGGSRTRPGSSIVQRVFQGRVRVETETLAAVGARAAAAAAAAGDTDDVMMIDDVGAPAPGVPGVPGVPGMPGAPFHFQPPHQIQPPPPPPPPPGLSSFSALHPQQQNLPPGVALPLGSSRPPPPRPPPGISSPSPASLASFLPPPSLPPPPPALSNGQVDPSVSADAALLPPPPPTTGLSRFLLLTLDLPPTPLFQDELERNIIPQVPLTTLLAKYDGASAREQGDVRRRFRLQAPLPPYLVLHMKRFSANKFVTERNPTIVTFDPQGLDMRPFVDLPAESRDQGPQLYDLVANVVHEAVRAGGDDVAVDSAEERRTWKVQLRERQAGPAEQDRWVVVQDLFVEPVAGELLYLAESYIQIWERRRVPGAGGPAAPGKAKANGR